MQYCRKCPDAVAEIRGGVGAPQLTGCVEFYQENGCVLIVARISGLSESKTGFFRIPYSPRGKLLRDRLFQNGKPL